MIHKLLILTIIPFVFFFFDEIIPLVCIGNRCGTCREECHFSGKSRLNVLYWSFLASASRKLFVSFSQRQDFHAGYLPSILDVNLLDEVIKVNSYYSFFSQFNIVFFFLLKKNIVVFFFAFFLVSCVVCVSLLS